MLVGQHEEIIEIYKNMLVDNAQRITELDQNRGGCEDESKKRVSSTPSLLE